MINIMRGRNEPMGISGNSVRSVRPAHAALAAAAAALAFLAGPLRAQSVAGSAWSYDHDMRLTYEVDDNVAERIDDPIRAQVARLAYRGDLRWGSSGEQRLSLSY